MSSKVLKTVGVWIVSGPSGSGKTSLVEALLKDARWKKRLMKSISWTTRSKRSGEKNGRDYHFVSKAKFLALKKRAGFLESEKIFDYYYGTPKKIVREAQEAGKDLLLCIDVKGARTVRRFFKKQARSIFIAPPGMEDLRARLTKRSTEGKKDIAKRLGRVKIELSYAKDYDYIVVNDDFNDALNQVKSILSE
jgi:guanylate kinase